EGNQKETSWIVDKEEFTEKNLAQNFILNSAITGERTEMIMIKVPLTDEKAREIIRKARGIDVTETIFRDKKIAEEYQDHEFWFRSPTSRRWNNLMSTNTNQLPAIDEELADDLPNEIEMVDEEEVSADSYDYVDPKLYQR
ncbi:13282_t:CDS:2, partial [Racocetra persica]